MADALAFLGNLSDESFDALALLSQQTGRSPTLSAVQEKRLSKELATARQTMLMEVASHRVTAELLINWADDIEAGRLAASDVTTIRRARRVFAFRGKINSPRGPILWCRLGQPTTLLPAFGTGGTTSGCGGCPRASGAAAPQIRAMLQIIEETVPVQRIWLDTAESKETPRTGFAAAAPGELLHVLEVMYRNLVMRRGLCAKRGQEAPASDRTIDAHPSLVRALPELLTNEN